MELAFHPKVIVEFPDCWLVQLDDEGAQELKSTIEKLIKSETKTIIHKKIIEEINKIIECNWEHAIMPKIKDWMETEKGEEFIEEITRMVLRKRIEKRVHQKLDEFKKTL
jgi:hypothetical protein